MACQRPTVCQSSHDEAGALPMDRTRHVDIGTCALAARQRTAARTPAEGSSVFTGATVVGHGEYNQALSNSRASLPTFLSARDQNNNGRFDADEIAGPDADLPSNPRLDFYGDGRGCNESTGEFEVFEALYGAKPARQWNIRNDRPLSRAFYAGVRWSARWPHRRSLCHLDPAVLQDNRKLLARTPFGCIRVPTRGGRDGR
jgi:hypothetical protein